jgi:GNAT superfamily N-acetyltransferase
MDRQISYRPMTPDDGLTLVRLHRRAILLEGVRAYSPDVARSWAFGLEAEGYARSAARGENIEVALSGAAVVGFCGTRADEVCGLYVDPEFQRMGAGSGLMRRALKRIHAGGHDRARVIAAMSGVPFYEAMGFRTLRGRMRPTRGGVAMRVLEMVRAFEPGVPPTDQAALAMTRLRPVCLAS